MERLSSFQLSIIIEACSKEGNEKKKKTAEKILEEREKEQGGKEVNKTKD